MPSYPTFLSLMWLFHNLIRYSSLSLSLSLHQHPQALSLFAIHYPHSLHLHSVTTSLNQYYFLKPSTTSNLIQVRAN